MKKYLLSILVIFLLNSVTFAGSIKIEPASKAQINIIQAALGDQYPISKTAAVESVSIRSSNNKIYYVGAVFHAVGVGSVTGIWLIIGEKYNPGLVLSVDGAAHQFSGMRKANETKAKAYTTDPEAEALRNYLNK